MIELPDFADPYLYENGFNLTCQSYRLGKLLAHYELYRHILQVPGSIIELGVFKGSSLARLATLRTLLEISMSRKLVAFDTFEEFPALDESLSPWDQEILGELLRHANTRCISVSQMMEVLRRKGCDQEIELVSGDVRETVPAYCHDHPYLRIALMNLDLDLYEPTYTALTYLYPRIEIGGVVMLDNYGGLDGDTQAIETYFATMMLIPRIQKFPFAQTPCYVIKE
jgi:hypothetical protein